MPTSGPNNPGTTINDTTIGGSPWINPNNSQVSDGVFATCTTAKLGTFSATNYLKATNFGFSIPVGSTINGILVEVQSKVNSGAATWSVVHLVRAGAIESITKTGAVNAITTTLLYSSIPASGSSSDLWGASWSVSDINNSGFGCVIRSNTRIKAFSVDNIRMTITYTSGGVVNTSSMLLVM